MSQAQVLTSNTYNVLEQFSRKWQWTISGNKRKFICAKILMAVTRRKETLFLSLFDNFFEFTLL